MTVERVALRFFLDEGVPDSVGLVLRQAGHQVTLLRESGIATGSADTVVCVTAEANDCILVAQDGDMKQLARDRTVQDLEPLAVAVSRTPSGGPRRSCTLAHRT